MGVADHPHSAVSQSENGTNHFHLYFQCVMSFLCVLTNPLHRHLSHGEEGVQSWLKIHLNICCFFFMQNIIF